MSDSLRTVMVVDDDELLRSLLEFKLVSKGFSVRTASDGESGLAAIRQARPDLVLLDAMMPGMDGFAVLQRLKSEPGLAEIPVIMLTARRQEADIVGALKSGVDDYIVKPFIIDELIMRVTRLLKPEA